MEVWMCKHFGVRLFESKDEFMRCIFREKNGSDICLPKRTPDGTTHNPCDAKKFVEEKVGRWLTMKGATLSHCSACKESVMEHQKFNYCPNCGARMTDENKPKE